MLTTKTKKTSEQISVSMASAHFDLETPTSSGSGVILLSSTSYSHINEIQSDFMQLIEYVQNSLKKLHPGLISAFNVKWEGSVIVTLTYLADLRKIELQTKDTLGQPVGMMTFQCPSPADRHRFFSVESIAASNIDNTAHTGTPNEISDDKLP